MQLVLPPAMELFCYILVVACIVMLTTLLHLAFQNLLEVQMTNTIITILKPFTS